MALVVYMNLSDICRKFENWRNGIPVIFPAFHGIRIILVSISLLLVQGLPELSFRPVPDRWFFKSVAKAFPVFIWNIFQSVSYLMDNTALIFCFRKSSRNSFFDSRQTISTRIRISFTPLFFSSFKTDSQYLELSLSPT